MHLQTTGLNLFINNRIDGNQAATYYTTFHHDLLNITPEPKMAPFFNPSPAECHLLQYYFVLKLLSLLTFLIIRLI